MRSAVENEVRQPVDNLMRTLTRREREMLVDVASGVVVRSANAYLSVSGQ
jgi:FixJ family two-component response regulator